MTQQSMKLDIAIVGIGAVMPIGLDRGAYWKAILDGVDGIVEVPRHRWNADLYYSEDRHRPEGTYSRIGAFVEGFVFDRRRFRLPPRTVEAMDPTQQMAVAAAVEALEDAGVDLEATDRTRIAVILGNALGGDVRNHTILRIRMTDVLAQIEGLDELAPLDPGSRARLAAQLEAVVKRSLPPVTEDTMPGELSNCIAGRVCNLLDLHGPSFTVDAACASSMAALSAACRSLRAGECDLALTGGADNAMGPEAYVKFSKIGALSGTGSRPFDERADGFVMGEGCGVLALRRLEDVPPGARVYAVVRAIGASSDGRGKGITAPNPAGQRLAIERAYQAAGFGLDTVGYVEAHGTSTPVGDAVECQVLAEALRDAGGRDHELRLGSVKSQIGHLKSAAGVAGLIKAAMALRTATLPPTIHFERPNAALRAAPDLAVQTRAEPWPEDLTRAGAMTPRRAGVSSFGFGGTNFHVVLEEPTNGRASRSKLVPEFSSTTTTTSASMGASEGRSMTTSMTEGSLVVALGATDAGALAVAAREVSQAAAAAGASLPEIVEARGLRRDVSAQPCRLAAAAGSAPELADQLARAAAALESGRGLALLSNRGVFAHAGAAGEPAAPLAGKIGMLFPGQGSQYLGMLRELVPRFAVVRDTLAEADEVMAPILGRPLTDYIFGQGFGGPEGNAKGSAEQALIQTAITQPAMIACDVALLRLLAAHGVRPDIVAGHSLGEYAACVAAGVLSFADALRTVAARGRHMSAATIEGGDPGWMAAVAASLEQVEAVLARVEGYVVPANKNCQSQTIIAGATDAVQRALAIFAAEGVQATRLPVSHAFHSRIVASASAPLHKVLTETGLRAPSVPILSNVTGDLYPTGPGAREAIIDLLAQQVASPVEWIAQIERMYALGVRTFLEVGPKRALASFVDSILEGRPHRAAVTLHPKKGELRSFNEALAALVADGVAVSLEGDAREPDGTNEIAGAERSAGMNEPVAEVLIRILCEKTGYDPGEIERDFELEADLGVDTVKQAEILAAVREHFGLARDEAFRLSDYPTVDALVRYLEARTGTSAAPAPTPDVATTSPEPHADEPAKLDMTAARAGDETFDALAAAGIPIPADAAAPRAHGPARAANEPVADVLVRILCEKTGYDPGEIERDFELEADLGVDTVKQAEILAAVREHFGLARDEAFRLSDYPTVDALVRYLEARTGTSEREASRAREPERTPEPVLQVRTYVYRPGSLEANAPDAGDGTFDALAAAGVPRQANAEAPHAHEPADEAVADVLVRILCEKTGYDPGEIERDFELEADLGVDTVKQAEILAAVREHFGLARDEAFRLSDYPTVDALVRYLEARTGTTAAASPAPEVVPPPPAGEPIVAAPPPSHESHETHSSDGSHETHSSHSINPDALVVSGVAAGLPGLDDPFAPDGFDRLLAGHVLIDEVGRAMEQALAAQGIVRVVKHGTGEPELVRVTDPDQVIHLAGRGRDPELGSRYGVPAELHEGLDTTTAWALAAAIEGLRDAGLPLVRAGHQTRSGRVVGRGWRLPEAVGRRTGVLFASAFPGYNRMIDEVQKTAAGRDGGEPFPRQFLVEVLSFAHAQVAQYVGALGPNAQVNAACASTPVALATATDWIKAGRCDRVIVIGADDVTSDAMLPFIGAGFLVSGAATTERDVSQAALPFDRRRNGMIMGMGAVALVVERARDAAERGVTPIAEILATRMSNSAFHAFRISPESVAEAVEALFDEVEARHGIDRSDVAGRCVFMSHEPYTPARGGSAQAEVAALRSAFGEQAGEVLVANTKGFTGHAMGAGLEEFVALRSLERQEVPPVPNLREPDPELGVLQLSRGGRYGHDYSLRIAAGFGSQIALWLMRRTCAGPDRIDQAALERWASLHSGGVPVRLEVEGRHLRAAPITDRPSVPPPRRDIDLGDLGQGLRAWQVVTEPAVDLPGGPVDLGGRPVVVLGGAGGEAEPVCAGLEALGARVIRLEDPSNGTSLDGAALEQALAARAGALGRPVGLINLLALEPGDGRDPGAEVQRRLGLLFHTVRAVGAPERFFVTLTALGGGCGIDGTSAATTDAAVSGAQAGFTKALAREWDGQGVTVKVVDLDRGAVPPAERAVVAVREGMTADGLVEVGHSRGRVTTALRSTLSATASPFVPAFGSVVVLTGGAGGVTAAAGQELVRRGVGRVAILDLAPLLSEDPAAIDVEAERAKIKAGLALGGERVTPVRVEELLKPIRAARRTAETIQAFTRAGAEVAYLQCDLADGPAVEAAIAEVRRRFGRIDGVIHGAGLEVSQALAAKSRETFDRVFRGKALGGINLWRALAGSPPSFFVAFSSVAGRFGNPGQQDYAAANEVLARLCAAAPPGVQALTVDWTAWDEIGMAASSSMRALMVSRGVDLLPPAVGTATLADLLGAGVSGEVVVCGRLGDLAAPRYAAGARAAQPGEAARTWLDRVVERDRDRLVAEVDLDPWRHGYLADHAIDGTKVLPGVVGLELMAEAARELLGGAALVEARGVRFERPVKVHDQHPVTLRLVATRVDDGEAAVLLSSRRTAAAGRLVEADHFRAVLRFGEATHKAPLERLSFDGPATEGPGAAEIYGPGLFFHGPGFQVLRAASRIGADYLVARVALPAERLERADGVGPGTTEPLAWEAALQAAGLWVATRRSAMALPHGVERAQHFAPVPASGELVARVAAVGSERGTNGDGGAMIHRFDVELLDLDGRLVQRALGMTLIETGASVALAAPPAAEREGGVVERVDLVFEGLHDAEWIDRLARCYLSAAEHQRLAELRSDKRRREWLHGHVAAKHLVRDHLRDLRGVTLDPRQIEVLADSNGAPRVRVADHPELSLPTQPLPSLAITHCHGRAVAALAPAGSGARLGIDLERIEPRATSFELNVLTDGERAVLDALAPERRDEWVTLLWVLKEAVSKALGLGLALDPREMEVVGVDARGEADVRLYGLARDRFDELGGRRLETRSRVEGDRAFAVALLELDEATAPAAVGDAAFVARPLEPARLATTV